MMLTGTSSLRCEAKVTHVLDMFVRTNLLAEGHGRLNRRTTDGSGAWLQQVQVDVRQHYQDYHR